MKRMTAKAGRRVTEIRRKKMRTRLGSGRVVVVGGQCSGVGKTALIEDILRAMPEMKWTAVKITPHGEAVPKRNTQEGEEQTQARCYGEKRRQDSSGAKKVGGGGVLIREETERGGRSDTSRFLAAGARRAIWVQCEAGRLDGALKELKKELVGSGSVIIESDSILEYRKPDLFLMVVDAGMEDFKESARAVVRKADAFVYRSPFDEGHGREWPLGGRRPGKRICKVLHPLGGVLPRTLREIIRQPHR